MGEAEIPQDQPLKNMNIELYLLLLFLLIGSYGGYLLYINYALSKSISRLHIDKGTGLIKGIGPFEFKKGDTAVLLIHGYTGTSKEMLPLARYLSERNISSYGILLPGHGSTPRELKKTTKEDWYNSAEKELIRMKKEYKSVYIAGFSIGSAIAIKLAANHQVEGIALLSPAVYLRKKGMNMLSVERQIKFLNAFLFYSYIKKQHPPDIKDPSVDENNPFYEFYPVNTLKHLIDTMKEARELLPKINCPILVIQSKGDIDLSEKGPEYIYKNAASTDKKVVWLERSGHIITLDYDRDRVNEEVYRFIAKC